MSNEIKIKKRGEGFKKFIKKYGYFIALAIVVLIVALSVVLTGQPAKTDIVVSDKEPVEVGSSALSFGLPLANCQVVHDYSRDALIFNETMGWFETHKGVDLRSETSKDVLACEGGEVVKVYTMGDVSKEICGGPHANNTAELGHFKIQKEESSSAGVRRIKAILN